MGKLVKVWRLPGAQKRLLIEAWWRLLVVAIALRLLPFQRVRAWAARVDTIGSRRPAVSADRAAWLIAVAGRHHPLPIRCLERAVALQWLLARHGLATQLRIGVRRESAPLQAHAWLENDGRPIPDAGLGNTGYEPLEMAAGRP